jgi:hypothetical protein
MADATCGPKLEACFGDYECRADLQEAIAASQYKAAEMRFERPANICRKTPQFQQLYECVDEDDGIFAWKRSSCLKANMLSRGQCTDLLDALATVCPDVASLAADGTATSAYTCNEECATALVTAWEYCQVSFSQRFDALPQQRAAVVYNLVRSEPMGACTRTFSEVCHPLHILCGVFYGIAYGGWNDCTDGHRTARRDRAQRDVRAPVRRLRGLGLVPRQPP